MRQMREEEGLKSGITENESAAVSGNFRSKGQEKEQNKNVKTVGLDPLECDAVVNGNRDHRVRGVDGHQIAYFRRAHCKTPMKPP